MDNVFEAVYMAAGGIMFALALMILISIDFSMKNSYDKVMSNNSVDEVLWWLKYE